MHEVLVNRLGGLSLPRKSVVRLQLPFLSVFDGHISRRNEPGNPLGDLVHVYCFCERQSLLQSVLDTPNFNVVAQKLNSPKF